MQKQCLSNQVYYKAHWAVRPRQPKARTHLMRLKPVMREQRTQAKGHKQRGSLNELLQTKKECLQVERKRFSQGSTSYFLQEGETEAFSVIMFTHLTTKALYCSISLSKIQHMFSIVEPNMLNPNMPNLI